jgi:Lipocalin-like domain
MSPNRLLKPSDVDARREAIHGRSVPPGRPSHSGRPRWSTKRKNSLKEQLAGTWTIISNDNDNTAPDGTKTALWSQSERHPRLVLAANGQYAQIIVLPDRPNFKVNNRLEGTPEENKAAVHGTTATFGTWSVDEANKTITVRNEGGMFPNRAGTESKRTVTLQGDQLRVSNPAPASGGRSESAWKRSPTFASK